MVAAMAVSVTLVVSMIVYSTHVTVMFSNTGISYHGDFLLLSLVDGVTCCCRWGSAYLHVSAYGSLLVFGGFTS